jgi:hypothetical protein
VRESAEVFLAIPVCATLLLLALFLHGSGLFDFRIFRAAGAAVLEHHSPWSMQGFRYPATAALAFAPFGALPFPAAAALFCLLCRKCARARRDLALPTDP